MTSKFTYNTYSSLGRGPIFASNALGMKNLKKTLGFILLASTLLSAASAYACEPNMAAFPRDCAIQDRFIAVKAKLAAQNMNVDEISDYRVIRFIDRYSWEMAKKAGTAPMSVYNPSPVTWDIWDSGIRWIFNEPNFRGILYRTMKIDDKLVAEINKVLLTSGSLSSKDPNTDPNKLPGVYRHDQDRPVGFCIPPNYPTEQLIATSLASVQRFQQIWEQKAGSFQEAVARYGGLNPQQATMTTPMSVNQDYTPEACPRGFAIYAPSDQVPQQMSWIESFIRANLDLYAQKKSVISPIALAAFTQKWLVTLHPFGDGNGRTSRAVQDIILANFGLPFAPGGDLQDDAMADFDVYLKNNYEKIEFTLQVLEYCAQAAHYELGASYSSKRPVMCKSVLEMNGRLPYTRDVGLLEVPTP